jgi:uncharacterized membrane protein
MEIFTQEGGAILSRWGHYLAGVTWIGLLYYFNFVQVPSFATFDAGPRTESVRKLVPRALWWFRYGALLTVLTGLSIMAFQDQLSDMDYFKTAPGMSIATGILLALIMFGNVWGIIWPNQKIFIANAEATAAGKEADPNAAVAARKAAVASRTNTFFSIPMLFFMGATSHFAGLYNNGNPPEGGDRAIYWIVLLVLVVIFEGIAISAPAVGKPVAIHIDKHRNTIIGGFIFWAVLILLWEILF